MVRTQKKTSPPGRGLALALVPLLAILGCKLGLLLEHGIPILIYVGEEDWICNHLGNRKMIEEIEWSRKCEFQKEKLYKWRVDGEVAGDAQHGGGLSWATIAGAGHMVPYEKGAQAQAMFHRWIDGEPL